MALFGYAGGLALRGEICLLSSQRYLNNATKCFILQKKNRFVVLFTHKMHIFAVSNITL